MNQQLRAQIEQLAEDRLPESQRALLLQSLDAESDGWRALALELLTERELRVVCRDHVAVAAPTPVALRSGAAPRWGSRLLALAASLLVAFAAGRWSQSDSEPVDVTAPPIATAPSLRESLGAENVVTLAVVDASGQRRELEVPLLDASEVDRRMGTRFPSQFSPSDVRALREQGYELQARQRYAPVMLNGVQPVMLPIEQPQVTPVSRYVY